MTIIEDRPWHISPVIRILKGATRILITIKYNYGVGISNDFSMFKQHFKVQPPPSVTVITPPIPQYSSLPSIT